MSADRIAPDATTRFAASHLGLFCLPMSHKKDARLNEKRDNKQCLLDTPRRVTVNNKRFISNVKSQRKNMHIYKSHGIIKNYKEKLL